MLKYAKIKNEETKQCEVGIGTNIEFYQSIGMIEMEVEQSYTGDWYLAGFAPQQSLAEQAQSVSMTKAEFLLLVTNLTPITLAQIEEYINSDDDLKIRFTYANSVERNHPMLYAASAVFNVTPELLDIMFVNKDVLITKIDAGEPIEGIG